jgi:hypothetical protein
VTLVAGGVHCEITTISGTAAVTAEENLNPVPGAAGADSYTVHSWMAVMIRSSGVKRQRSR